jgi:hypothetical protein
MTTFKFETSMPFPLTRVRTEVHHTEVKKPSGVSYILLVLINESNDKKMKLKDLLIQFGVSRDLYPIFADEIHTLIHDLEIIECTPYQYNKQHFDEYTIGNFKLTAKGKKVFKEELIPSKNTVRDKEDYWFDPGRNKLLTNIPTEWRIGKIKSSELPNNFAEQFTYTNNSGMEEFLNSKKGTGICVKKEEAIIEVNILEQDFFFTTFPIHFAINIEENRIDFTFEEMSLKDFFDRNYKSDLKARCLAVKRKFKFKSIVHKVKKLDSNRKVIGLYYPEMYEQLLKTDYDITITKGNYESQQRQNVFESSESIMKLSKRLETLHFSHKKAIALAPLEISFNDTVNDGIIELPFLAEIELKEEDVDLVLRTLTESFKEYKMDNIKDLFTVFSYLNDFTSLTHRYEEYLSEDVESNINVLKSIKDLVDITKFENWFKAKANNMYEKYFEVISLAALDYQLTFGNWLLKYLDISDNIIIKNAFNTNQDVSNLEIYDALESVGFKQKDILKETHLYHDFILYILGNKNLSSNSKLFLKVKTIRESFIKLQDLTGLQSIAQFAIKEDVDKKQYRETYTGFKQKIKEVDFPKNLSGIEIKEFDEFVANFDYLFTLFSEEYSASHNPKDIGRNQIEKKIKSSDYFSAVIYLSVKMEWALKEKLKLNGNLFDMINSIDDEIVTKDEKEFLHLLRKERNNLVHPNRKRTNLSVENLTNILDIVFKEEMVQ